MPYVYLGIAILAEVVGTTALKWSDGMSKGVPSLIVIVAYSVAFYSLSLALKTISVGIAYAIWAGLGMVLIAVLGAVIFKERLDLAAYGGIGLIIAGVIVLNVVSKAATH
jgi:small multidrug resistance pump